MKTDIIDPDDVRSLKSLDILLSYCERQLAPVRKRGSLARCRCPYGAHTRHDHLELAARDGVGVAYCHACGAGGDVLNVAAAVLGVDLRGHFADVVRHVAEVTGYTLRETVSGITGSRPKKRKHGAARDVDKVRRMAEQLARQMQLAPEPPPLDFLPEEDAAIALSAVHCARQNPELMERHADTLGIPLAYLMAHTDMELAMRGLLGLAPDGRLLYVYTMRDAAGALRIACVKLRGNSAEEQKALIRNGRWKFCGSMRYDGGKPARFIFAAGKPCALYGVDELEGHYIAFLTEGESDKLALDYVLNCHREAHQIGIDAPEDYIPEDFIPVAVAKPSASTFKPEWAAKLAGMAVVIIGDKDTAGENGARETARILRAAGAREVYRWTPPEGFKDARDMVNQCQPREVYNNIINNKLLAGNEQD